MKKFIILLLVSSFSILINGQTIDSVYTFPIKPGTKTWENKKSEKERFEALQIPTELLAKMSTKSLIKTCINYPAFGHFMAFENSQIGFKHLVKNFNGLKELLSRKDGSAELLKYYIQMNILTGEGDDTNVNKELWSLRGCYFEYFLSQDEIIEKMDEKSYALLLKEARKKLNQKIDKKAENSSLNFEPSLLIMGKVLNKSKDSEFIKTKSRDSDMDKFLNSGNLSKPAVSLDIINLTDIYLKKHAQ